MPWLGNKRNSSCIPEGKYKISPYSSDRFSYGFKVNYVRARGSILFHKGNSLKDTEGCILPGLFRGKVKGAPFIHHSNDALIQLIVWSQSNDFNLLIKEIDETNLKRTKNLV